MEELDQMLADLESDKSFVPTEPAVVRRAAPGSGSARPSSTYNDRNISTTRSPVTQRKVGSPPVWKDSNREDPNATNCNECRTRIFRGQDAYTHEGQAYCIGCLCGGCGSPLQRRPFSIAESGRKHCPECVCRSCSKPIDGKFARSPQGKICLACCCQYCRGPLQPSDDRPLCNNCRCAGCRTCLEGKYYPGDDGGRYCEQCIEEQGKTTQAPRQKGPMCPKCRTEIIGQYIECQGNKFHQTCFSCVDCNQQGSQILSGQVYCNQCHPDKALCCVCKQSLRGTGFEALERLYHENCFTCQRCNTVLQGGRFKEIDGYALCAHCAIEIVESGLSHQ